MSETEELLTVAAVARRLGVAPATLRTWDRRYGLGPSEHSSGEHRRYNGSDLARLTLMRKLVIAGVSPAEAAQRAAEMASEAGRALAEHKNSIRTEPEPDSNGRTRDDSALPPPKRRNPAAEIHSIDLNANVSSSSQVCPELLTRPAPFS